MLQCNRYPGLDANEIIRLTSAIGQERSVTLRRRLSFRGPLKSESCRMAYGSTSAKAVDR